MIAFLAVAADPSHVPFFIAGGVFAVWAVVLAWVGLNRPEFPFGVMGQRAVIGVSFALAAVALAMAIVTA